MSKIKIPFFMEIFLLAVLCYSKGVFATETLQLDYRAASGIQPSRLIDGAILGNGRITFRSSHIGFRIGSEHLLSGQMPGHYLLTGTQNSNHQLRVRLELKDGQPDNTDKKSMIIHTGNNIILFNVVVDGTQHVAVDRYAIDLKASAITR